ncbi:MAG TPA: hypothetical protein VJ725_22720, partial [Thermoanaerobaculia bacterium]|nr:hypothetical protein [Thermoanaerobaculia bacterium]
VSLDEAPAYLKPGLTARVDLVLASAPDSLSVPIEAVLERDAREEAARFEERRGGEEEAEADGPVASASGKLEEGVFVIAPSGRLRFVPVRVTVAGSEAVAVESPALHEGDRVVVGPFRILKTLHAGLAVEVKP